MFFGSDLNRVNTDGRTFVQCGNAIIMGNYAPGVDMIRGSSSTLCRDTKLSRTVISE
jgi:hypothetical protein